jgi:orotate phosphoribosyltransferase-like protein
MKRTDEGVELVKAMRQRGMSWEAAGAELGISGNTARSWIDKDYMEMRNRRARDCRVVPGFALRDIPSEINTRDDALARLALIPEDTRDTTARICGDPLPGRSALDRRTQS